MENNTYNNLHKTSIPNSVSLHLLQTRQNDTHSFEQTELSDPLRSANSHCQTKMDFSQLPKLWDDQIVYLDPLNPELMDLNDFFFDSDFDDQSSVAQTSSSMDSRSVEQVKKELYDGYSSSEIPSSCTSQYDPSSSFDHVSNSVCTNDDSQEYLYPSASHMHPHQFFKKSKRHFVKDSQKDDKYWARRIKNNMAAKRSRDSRRVKENQIGLRAAFLEMENNDYRSKLEKIMRENMKLKTRLSHYEGADHLPR